MVNDLMVSQLYLRNQDVHLSGMSHVLTHLQPHMRYRQRQKQELLQLWQSGKKTKYDAIVRTHLFYLIAIETSGVLGPNAYEIVCDLAC